MKRTTRFSGKWDVDFDAETQRRGVKRKEDLLKNSALPPRLSVSASKILASTILIILTAGVPFAAETAEQRGKRVVDEAIAALGGDAFLRVQDRVELNFTLAVGANTAAVRTRFI